MEIRPNEEKLVEFPIEEDAMKCKSVKKDVLYMQDATTIVEEMTFSVILHNLMFVTSGTSCVLVDFNHSAIGSTEFLFLSFIPYNDKWFALKLFGPLREVFLFR